MFSGIIEVNFPVIKGSNDFFIPKYFLRCAYADTGEARDSHLCFVDGVKCRADEARFGGIIIQPVEDSVPRRA